MLFHSLRFLEADLQDAKERYLVREQEGKLAVEQLRETERKKAEAVRKLTVLFTQLSITSRYVRHLCSLL